MAIYTETKQPYEFLVRWDDKGKLQGSHVGMCTRTFKDGVQIACSTDSVMPVNDGLREGYPLADILALVQSGFADKGAALLLDIAATAANQAKADADKAACNIACAAAEAAKVKADLATEAAKAALEAQLTAEKALETQ